MPVVHPCSRQDCGVLTMGEFCLLHEGEAARAGRADARRSALPQARAQTRGAAATHRHAGQGAR